jgi:hypothetical protein
MSLQDAAQDMGISVNSLKRICRKLGIPKWPYRQRFGLERLQQKLQRALESETPLGDPTIHSQYRQVTLLLQELDTRGFVDTGPVMSAFPHDFGIPGVEGLDEDGSSRFSAFDEDRLIRKRVYGNYEDPTGPTTPSPSTTGDEPEHEMAPKRSRPDLTGVVLPPPVPLESRTTSNSLDLLAHIAMQHSREDESGTSSGGEGPGKSATTKHSKAQRHHQHQEHEHRNHDPSSQLLQRGPPLQHPRADPQQPAPLRSHLNIGSIRPGPPAPGRPSLPPEMMPPDQSLMQMVYAAQVNVQQLARRVYSLESTLYHLLKTMHGNGHGDFH